jgi:hypothetical protein
MIRVNTHLILIAVSLSLIGCTTQITTKKFSKNVNPEVIPGKVLIPNQKNTASVGEVMFTAGEYSKEATGLKLETFSITDSQIVKVKHKQHTFAFSIQPEEYDLYNQNEEGSYYKAKQNLITLRGTPKAYGGLFVPKGASEATDIFWSWNSNPDTKSYYQAKLATPIKGIQHTKTSFLNDGKRSVAPSARITYAGVANGQIRFVYNEFTAEGYIRPAFTQEVGLDYKPKGTYAYKSALFKVNKADSTHIDFEIIKPLD